MLLTVALLSGCSRYNKKVKKTIAAIGFVADGTITMLIKHDPALTRDETLLVRRIMPPGEAEDMRVEERGADERCVKCGAPESDGAWPSWRPD